MWLLIHCWADPRSMWVLFKGGMNLNSVPDLAEFTIDIRTIPGQDNETILRRVKAYLVMRQP
jgi:acetylornithine deacetylase/succinyl-diaminopimelate desuccinylase-like protein